MNIPKTDTGKYQIEYTLEGHTYEYCDKNDINTRIKELEQLDAVIIGIHPVPIVRSPINQNAISESNNISPEEDDIYQAMNDLRP